MELVLSMDLRCNLVVHGKSGSRATYKPLDWGISPTAEPIAYVRAVAPRFLYIADLDRIEGTGSHDKIVRWLADEVVSCYVDRGCRSPDDMLDGHNLVNIVGTETGGSDLSRYRSSFLSVDVKDGKAIPSGSDPADLLRAAGQWNFSGAILLDLGAVGTGNGIEQGRLARFRDAYTGKLFYGGGVATTRDLDKLASAGFDGAIIATALYKGTIPLDAIREGRWC